MTNCPFNKDGTKIENHLTASARVAHHSDNAFGGVAILDAELRKTTLV